MENTRFCLHSEAIGKVTQRLVTMFQKMCLKQTKKTNQIKIFKKGIPAQPQADGIIKQLLINAHFSSSKGFYGIILSTICNILEFVSGEHLSTQHERFKLDFAESTRFKILSISSYLFPILYHNMSDCSNCSTCLLCSIPKKEDKFEHFPNK